MGYYTSFRQYSNKFATLSGKPQKGERKPRRTMAEYRAFQAQRREVKEIRTIRQAFENMANRFSRRSENESRSVLIKEIYRMYIPTIEEYNRLKPPSARSFFSGFRAPFLKPGSGMKPPNPKDYKTKKGRLSPRKFAGAQRAYRKAVALEARVNRQAFAKANKEYGRALRTATQDFYRSVRNYPGAVMRAQRSRTAGAYASPSERRRRERAAVGNKRRKWQRFGKLIMSERGSWEFNPGEDHLSIILRNNAVNRKGVPYSVHRANLGTLGHRQNSIWTKSVWWQMQALEKLRPKFMEEVSRTVNRIFESD